MNATTMSPISINFLVILVLTNSLINLVSCYGIVKWTVEIQKDVADADTIAHQSGCLNLGLVRGFNDVYIFSRDIQNKTENLITKRSLETHPAVNWVDPQKPHMRVKRDHFNDELWKFQWYLQDNSNVANYENEIGLNVQEVWRMGYTGKGVVVAILDDGLEWNHTDIFPNYDSHASWDMNNNISDPFPRYDSSNSNNHGTRCAGEVAMVANNGKCGVGVAPQARIGGIKCLDGEVIDSIESMSLLHNLDYIDIYSGSWGPSDNGQTLDGPKRLATQALERGALKGRGGKGVLYVWANGNGGALGDDCNCDGYVNSIYTIAVGGVTQHGQIPFYGERCSSTMAVACSSGGYKDRKVVTTDLHNTCTIDYTGSSAAAPLAAGIFALVLEANPNITWRDAQHLTVFTSNPLPLSSNPGWRKNGVGFIFNHRFGFGLLDAKMMVTNALKWINVPAKSSCAISSIKRLPLYLQSRQMLKIEFLTDGCQNGPAPVNYIEHVQLILDMQYTRRGQVDVLLVSPSGTISHLLARRPLDDSVFGFDNWALMSVHFWGEFSYGQWTLLIRDRNGRNERGLVRNVTLILHGTRLRPEYMTTSGGRTYDIEIESFLDTESQLDEEDPFELNSFPNELEFATDETHPLTFSKSVIALQLLRRLAADQH